MKQGRLRHTAAGLMQALYDQIRPRGNGILRCILHKMKMRPVCFIDQQRYVPLMAKSGNLPHRAADPEIGRADQHDCLAVRMLIQRSFHCID